MICFERYLIHFSTNHILHSQEAHRSSDGRIGNLHWNFMVDAAHRDLNRRRNESHINEQIPLSDRQHLTKVTGFFGIVGLALRGCHFYVCVHVIHRVTNSLHQKGLLVWSFALTLEHCPGKQTRSSNMNNKHHEFVNKCVGIVGLRFIKRLL